MKYVHRKIVKSRRNKRIRKIKANLALITILIVLFYLIATWLSNVFAPRHILSPLGKAHAESLPQIGKKLPLPLTALNAEQRVNWEVFKINAKIITKIYDYPANVLLAQAALESARGTSDIAIDKNNYFGMNANDDNPYNDAFTYDNAIQSMIDYMYRIKKYYPDAYAVRNDPDLMIQLIKNDGYATDPEYVSKVKSMLEWQEK